MVSDSDTLVLRSVPVHPSSRSPTDEHWKQIWGIRALFSCLTDLSESSLACVSLYPSQTDTSRAQFYPLGILASRCCLPIYLIYSLLGFPPPLCCWSPMCISLFISNVSSVQTISGVYAYKLWNTKGINHCHLVSRSIALGARAWVPCTPNHCCLV